METSQCSDCGKYLSPHSVWRHKKNSCNMKTIQSSKPSIEKYQQQPKDPRLSSNEIADTSKPHPSICDDIINKIINSGEPSKKRIKRKPDNAIATPKETLPEGDNKEFFEIAKLHLPKKIDEPSKPKETLPEGDNKEFFEIAKFYLPKKIPSKPDKTIYLPIDDEALKEKLRLLYAEFLAGNKESTRPQIEFILRELRHRRVITKENYRIVSDCLSESDTDSSDSSESESEQEEINELDFDNIVRATIQNLTRNDRQNVYNLMGNSQDIQESIDKYLKGEKQLDDFTNDVDKLDEIRLMILLNNMKKTTNRVRKILNSLKNIDDNERAKVLDQLKNDKVITEPEYHRLLTSNNNLMSFAKAVQGSGVWI